ncbi:phosphoribosylaminoimidazole-succinocarboxamide synthase [Citrobacter koseri]|nr:phosphoribosylaminoimidazole-succinocarboxamide synthase [Citrobacter koseri]
MQKQAELYRGKAKTVYSTENPDLLVLEFRNDTSAGDGARIEQFDRKGMVNNKFNHFIMTKLAEAGIPTQMEQLLSDTECLVKKLDMVPVECVVRNRAAGSLVKRLGIEEGIELNPAAVRPVPEKRCDARSDGQRFLLRNLRLGEQRESGAHERTDLQS